MLSGPAHIPAGADDAQRIRLRIIAAVRDAVVLAARALVCDFHCKGVFLAGTQHDPLSLSCAMRVDAPPARVARRRVAACWSHAADDEVAVRDRRP